MEEIFFGIRRAVLSDIDDIAELTKEAFTKYRTCSGAQHVAALEETYEDIKSDVENKLVLVAFERNVIVGCVRLEVSPDNKAYLTRFAVRNNKSNSGIGKVLINTAVGIMRDANVEEILLHTCRTVKPLMYFYESCGFHLLSCDNSRGSDRALLSKKL